VLTPDRTDVRLLRALVSEPRLTVSELAERAGVARNTAQARLDRLHRRRRPRDNERGGGPAPARLLRLRRVSVQIEHQSLEGVVAALEQNPAVAQVEETVGAGDLLVRVAARDADDLQSVVHSLLGVSGRAAHHDVGRAHLARAVPRHPAAAGSAPGGLSSPRSGTDAAAAALSRLRNAFGSR
jgi:DNA-binding Lrp family transcriptional regulator